jgi:hypothetical protein
VLLTQIAKWCLGGTCLRLGDSCGGSKLDPCEGEHPLEVKQRSNWLQTSQQETSLMTECIQLEFELAGSSETKIKKNFRGENVSTDRGLVPLRKAHKDDEMIGTMPEGRWITT